MSKDVLVFDTETTGLPLHPDAPLEKQPRIIEFGAALLSGKTGKLIKEINILINPGIDLDPVITKITGITDADLVDQPTFKEAWGHIRAAFKAAGSTFAHNSPFDEALVNYELARLGVTDFAWPERFCTIALYRPDYGYDMKLTQLYERVMGKPLAQTHRALDDVRALAAIIQRDKLWRIAP